MSGTDSTGLPGWRRDGRNAPEYKLCVIDCSHAGLFAVQWSCVIWADVEASLWTHLYVSEQLGQVKLPLLTEAGELQQEANGVVGLIQTRQTLHGSYCIQTLSRRESSNFKV